VLGSFGLAIVSVLLLFFITPHVALKKTLQMNLAAEVTLRVRNSIFGNGLLFFVGVLPLALVLFFLILGATMTKSSFVTSEAALALSIQWMMMMIPFCLIMTPFVIFFFNFSLESYLLVKKKEKTSIEEKKAEEPCLV
jgi:hypothetical protein